LRYENPVPLQTSRSGLDAWDVHRLIAPTADFPGKEIDLGEIWEVDSVYWFDDGDEVPTVRNVVNHTRLVNEADLASHHPWLRRVRHGWHAPGHIRRTGIVATLNDRRSEGLGGYLGEGMATRESHYGK
jgi:hypothetical protein